jgi:hypothetical protein
MKRTILICLAASVISLAGCHSTNERVVTRLNTDATLPSGLPGNPVQGRVITSWVDKTDKQHATMSTLYGNDIAIQYARSHAGQNYPANAVLSLVTWNQQEDPRWFGGNIPQTPRSVEVVTVKPAAGAAQYAYDYQRYEGSPLTRVAVSEYPAKDRTAYLLSQRAAVMP